MIPAFVKIFSIGTDYIKDIFNEEVEVSEKIDGSQFGWGKVNGELFIRSKGAQLFVDNPNKMFQEGVDYIRSIEHLLPEGIAFYGEYLKKPKHNTLIYNRVPKNHIILFGAKHVVGDTFTSNLDYYANELDLEVVPRVNVKIYDLEQIKSFLDTESCLGGPKIEGVVVKNYNRAFLLGGQPIPMMCGKFVSEIFKEVHKARWNKEENGKGRFQTFCDSFKTDARWEKAVQHLNEAGQLEHTPRDIGKLFKEIAEDIESEEKEAIKDWLWNEYRKDIIRAASVGFADWYKSKLLNRAFEGGEIAANCAGTN